jgi:hypothetical protein
MGKGYVRIALALMIGAGGGYAAHDISDYLNRPVVVRDGSDIIEKNNNDVAGIGDCGTLDVSIPKDVMLGEYLETSRLPSGYKSRNDYKDAIMAHSAEIPLNDTYRVTENVTIHIDRPCED